MGRILCKMTDSGVVMSVRALKTMGDRLRGLLGTDDDAEEVALCGCSSIHTWGMRYNLDVALVSRKGEVLKSVRSVPPRRFVSAPGAYYAFERPASHQAWPSQGSWVSIAEVDRVDCKRIALAKS